MLQHSSGFLVFLSLFPLVIVAMSNTLMFISVLYVKIEEIWKDIWKSFPSIVRLYLLFLSLSFPSWPQCVSRSVLMWDAHRRTVYWEKPIAHYGDWSPGLAGLIQSKGVTVSCCGSAPDKECPSHSFNVCLSVASRAKSHLTIPLVSKLSYLNKSDSKRIPLGAEDTAVWFQI
jgi:hypothetical protein